MGKLIELKWSKSASEINQLVNSIKSDLPLGFSENEFQDIRKSLRNDIEKIFNINIDDKKIYATGHQPDIHHPGIITKDFLLHYLSNKNNAFPIHIVVDTDYFEFEFFHPVRKEGYAELHQFSAHSHSTFKSEKVEDSKRDELLKILQEQKKTIECFLNPVIVERANQYLDIYLNKIQMGDPLHSINEEIRKIFLTQHGINLPCLPVTELVSFPSFLKFVEKIRERLEEFTKIHNESLAEYRKEHKIKNHAQPIPDLKEKEMPFWGYENRERIAFNVDEKPNIVFPRAISLTMFLRIFLADFFIHGTGGGRYEAVSDKIIEKFFQIKPAPYEIATATLHLENTQCFSLPKLDEKDIEKKLRDLQFSPEKFLPAEHELVQEKKSYQERFKDPNENKKDLHEHITLLNEKMKTLVQEEKSIWENEKAELPNKLKTKQVFETRNFPFFYYNMKELISKIQSVL